jgi:hypothetical protein
MGPSATNQQPLSYSPPLPLFGLGPAGGNGPADGTLSAAAKHGKLVVAPFNPIAVVDTGASYTITPDGGKSVTIPKNAPAGSLNPEQQKALGNVQDLLGRIDGTSSFPTQVEADPKTTGSTAPKEKVQVQTSPKAKFDPAAAEFNNRFDATIGRTDIKTAGAGKHYLNEADAAAVCKALGYTDVKAMQKALNAGGLKPPLALDGKLGGRTLQALTDKILADKTFAFPEIKTADDAMAFARVTELLVEQASTTESASGTGEFKTRLTDALRTAISKAPVDVQNKISEAADGMTSTGKTDANPDDAADAKSILGSSVKPDTGKIATMTADELVVAMAKPGALDGDSGIAIRARLKDPEVLLKVAGNATAMANPTIAAEVTKAIGELDVAGVNALAKGLGKTASEPVQKALLAQIDVLAGKLMVPADVDTLVSLRESWFAVRPADAEQPKSFDEASLRMIKAAALTDLEAPDGAKTPFLEKLAGVRGGGPLTDEMKKAVTERCKELKTAEKDKVVDARKTLGEEPTVDKVYQKILGKIEDGISGKEDDDINAMIKELGEVDSKGQMSDKGSALVGALIERLKANGKWGGMIEDYGRSERKDLLRMLAHIRPTSVSPETLGDIARLCEDKLGSKDAATKDIKESVRQTLGSADGTDKAKMMLKMRPEHDLTRSYLVDRDNFKDLAVAFPDGRIASEFADVFENDEQRVAFMNQLIDTIADPRESDATRQWAMATLDHARLAFRKPLEDGDLGDVQEHLNTVNAGNAVPADAREWLAKFHKTLEEEKKIN